MGTWIVLGVIALVAVFAILIYNRLVAARAQVDEAWSDIQVQMKRRYDLIPNLVETVKGYASHERETLEAVIQARNSAVNNTGSPESQAASENILSGALGKLFALAEAYPTLKADQNFRQLQDELTQTEDKISRSRRFYNGSVKAYNVMIQSFPANLFARSLGFSEREFLEFDDPQVAEPVKVDFGTS
ncbi:LemA family protein [Amorphus coralli]|uniref:LemA family protein n=1 Tax=Amorphus coralli TaxID=340680 RepID=UPI00035E8080|nr:LemA family protein [Amorphus coralli]